MKKKSWDQELIEIDTAEATAKRIEQRAERFFLDFIERKDLHERAHLEMSEVESLAESAFGYSQEFEHAREKFKRGSI